MSPGGAAPAGQPVAVDSFISQSGVIAIQLGACNPRSDVAVLTYAFAEYPTYAWAVRLSDGKILRREAFDRNSLAGIVASPDGKLLAENSNFSTGYLQPGPAAHTVIRRVADGSFVAGFNPTVGVLAFSADDSVALVNTSPWASGVATHLALVQVDTGAQLWRYDGAEEFAASLAEPDGASFAVMLQTTTDQSPHPAVDVVIVRGDGTSTALPGKYIRP
jgi:hypothetical protein